MDLPTAHTSIVEAARPGAPEGAAFRLYRPASSASVRLFCFPYAGAGAGAYLDWPALVPPWLELVGAVYPGREARSMAPPLRRLDLLVEALADAMAPWLDRPFALFGHSMGAYVAFEVGRRLVQLGRVPESVFVSGAGAPHLPPPHPLHHLSPRDFLAELIRLNGFPAEVLRSAELLRHVLPILRADFVACETHRLDSAEPVDFPLHVLCGDCDPRVDGHRLAAWRTLAAGVFSQRLFEGDHFYLHHHARELLAWIGRELSPLARESAR